MWNVSGAHYKNIIDGNAILLKISKENDKHRWVYIGGDRVCSSLTHDDFYKYISNMENNSIPYSFAFGDEHIYFLTPHFNFNKWEMID